MLFCVEILLMQTTITTPQTESSARVEASVWLATALQGWSLLVLTLHLLASQLDAVWSVWAYTFLPVWIQWPLALIAGLLVIPRANLAVQQIISRVAEPLSYRPYMWFGVATLAAGGIFWLARLRHLRWGDAYMLSVLLSYPDLDIRVIYNWQAPLTVWTHQRLWQFVADPWFGWPVETVYATVSIVAGMIFVFLLLNFTARLGRSRLEASIIAGLMLTTGAVQLFFGYVENYTLISVLLLLTLYLAWRAVYGQLLPLWAVLAFSVTNGFHPSTVFLWPAVWVLVWLCWRRGFVSLPAALTQLMLPPLLVGGGVFALMESGGHGVSALTGVDRPGGGDAVWFVPLFEVTTEWQRYTMFSAAHLIDWANVHFLIAPFGLPMLVLIGFVVWRFGLTLFDSPAERDYALFLGVMSGCYVLFTWLWNADYGGQNDWDLFAPSAFVYTLLAGYLLVRAIPQRTVLSATGVLVIGVSLVHTASWIFLNTHELPHR